MDEFVEKLKVNIKSVYYDTIKCVNANIKRGHKRSISTEVENEIACLIVNELSNVKIFIDPTITIEKQCYRPDILVIDSSNKVLFYIEVKTNMGYCRDASSIADDMEKANSAFINKQEIKCKFKIDTKTNKYETISIKYDNDVKMFLLSLTEENSSPSTWFEKNKEICNKKGIDYYNLFSNWYNELSDKDIYEFVRSIKDFYNMK